jgi:hypothetical protein
MNDLFPPDAFLKEPRVRHRNQTLWQIYLPLVVGFAAFLVLGILVVLSQETGNPELSRWAAIATIWLVLPLLAFGVVALLANLLFIFLFSKINSALPDYGRLARFYTYRLSKQIQHLADRLVEPGISFRSGFAGLKSILSIFHK